MLATMGLLMTNHHSAPQLTLTGRTVKKAIIQVILPEEGRPLIHKETPDVVAATIVFLRKKSEK